MKLYTTLIQREVEASAGAPNILIVGNRIYTTCIDCGKVVHINKWLFGSMHLCLTEEEIEAKHVASKE